MIKQIITTTTLIAASVVMANAATDATWSSTTSNGHSNQATSAGILFNLSSSRLITTAIPEGITMDSLVSLDSIKINWTPTSTGILAAGNTIGFVLTDASKTILGVSGNSSDGNIQGGNFTYTFEDVQISSNTSYYVWFTNTIDVSALGGIGGTLVSSTIRSNTVGIDFAQYTTESGTGLEVIKTASREMWNTQYAPIVTIATSAIPEPSMFGLLAGLGALALVGARRRRK